MITIRPGTPADAAALQQLFAQSFTDTFGPLYAAEDLAAFLNRFTLLAWTDELNDPDLAFRIAEEEGVLAGYCKVGPPTLPTTIDRPTAELRQLYLAKPWIGTGLAPRLMNWALDEARRREAAQVILTVYADNHRARRFYERYGFEEIGSYKFMVGNHADDDRIMRLVL